MGFTRDQLLAHEGEQVPDLVGDDVRLLFVGINPGLWTAATRTHFAHPGNRFYKALHRGGIVPCVLDVSEGMTPEQAAVLTGRGIGITNVVARATARASDLTAVELRAGAQRLVDKVERWRPAVVAIVGITAYRTAFRRPDAVAGRQPEDLAGAGLWVLGNPSGLNAHETPETLGAAYREAAGAAGVPLVAPPS